MKKQPLAYLLSALTFLFLFGCWEVCSHLFDTLDFVLPPPSHIAACIWEKGDRFVFHTIVTLREMCGGFCLALVMAFPLAWIMHAWKTPRLVLQPFFVVIQCVPMFTLAPIMVICFDWSYLAIVIPTALMIFFPLTMNLYQGLRSTPQNLLDYFYLNRATPWQRFIKLQLPWALPHVFAGFRISAAIAGVGAVAGEWAGAQEGLGLLMIESRRGADLEMTFGALFCLTLMSVSLYLMMLGLEKRAMSRRPPSMRSLKIKTACLFLLMGVYGWGCKESSGQEKQVRLILDWLPNPNHVPLYSGIKKGIFRRHGIDLMVKKMRDPGDAISYLTSGQVELAISYMPHTLRSMAKGADVQPIAVLIKEPLNSLIYRRELNVEKPADLNGKAVGYCVDGSTCRFLDTLLQLNQIKPKAKYNVSCDLVSSLRTKKVDVIYGAFWNIECEHLRALGVEADYFSLSELGVPHYPELIILARSHSLYASEEFVSRLQEALQESIDFSVAHPDEAFDLYVSCHPDKRDKTCQWEKEAWLKTLSALADTQKINKSPTLQSYLMHSSSSS
ncbi:MAG: ABC transporter substrate-binding protein [Waddliaceae bacterium]